MFRGFNSMVSPDQHPAGNCFAPRTSRRAYGVLIALLMLLATWQAIRHARSLLTFAEDPYRAVEFSAKYTALAPYLSGVNRVGWIASRPPSAGEWDEVEFSMARFTLVPTLVCNRKDLPLIIAHFDSGAELDRLLASGEFQLVTRVRDSLALVRRVHP